MDEHPDTPGDTPNPDPVVDAVASSPSQDKASGSGLLKQVAIVVALIGAIGVVAAAFVPVVFKQKGRPPSTSSQPTVSPSLLACTPTTRIEVEGVPATSGPTLDFTVVVRCAPQPGDTYWVMTRYDSEGKPGTPLHTEWYPDEPVSGVPAPHNVQHSLTGEGVTRSIFVVSCDPDGVLRLTTERYNGPKGPLLAFPHGCELASNEAQVLLD
jgi:hypothetical protein